MPTNVSEIIQLLLPLIVLELALKIYALVKLTKVSAKHLPKWAWILIIIFVSTLGPLSFLLFGAGEAINKGDA